MIRKANPFMENKSFSAMKYESKIAYKTDKIVSLGIGTMSQKCVYCDALKFKEEASEICCSGGKVQLPSFLPLPESLYRLILLWDSILITNISWKWNVLLIQ